MSEVDPNGLNQHTAGAKLDAGKVDMSLLVLWPRALLEVCRVGTLGASKYSRGGFLSVANGPTRYTAALLRHLLRESMGEVYDQDPYYDTTKGLEFKNKIRHDAQVAWNALSRLELTLREEENERKAITSVGAGDPIVSIPSSILSPVGAGLPYIPGPSGDTGGFGLGVLERTYNSFAQYSRDA